jgi:three-Cys-motif partner protein
MAEIVPVADAPDDDLLTREAGPWVLDKLGIVACYAHGFAIASQRERRWYCIDGFAGPGVITLKGSGLRVPGAPLIALRTQPEFRRCIMLEQNRIAVEALRARTAEFGDRAVVERGNVNVDLVPLIYTHAARSQPCLCVLDPEGAELQWATVAAIADFKRGLPHKVEQLILLPTDTGFIPDLPRRDEPPELVQRDLRGIFGNDRWREIYIRRRRGALTPDEARTEYVRLYARGFRDLGYRTVLARPILRHGRLGATMYFLIFATDDEAARTVMDRCFETVSSKEPPSPE